MRASFGLATRVDVILEPKTNETFAVDPVARRSGAIKTESTVSGSAVVSSALARLLAPLGMTYVVRNEDVVLTTAR